MLTVTIKREAVSHVSKTTGNKYLKQTGQVQLVDRDGVEEELPRLISFIPNESYPAGEYFLSIASFIVGKYDALELGRVVLTPKAASAVASSKTAALPK